MPKDRKESQRKYSREWYLRNREKHNAGAKRWYLANKERVLEMEKRRFAANPEKRRAWCRKWYRRNALKLTKRARHWQNANPEKAAAHRLITLMIYFGLLERPAKCSQCGKECKAQAHHHRGYSKEFVLDVIWLCQSCHSKANLALKMLTT